LCPEQTKAYRNKLEFTFTDRRWLSYEELDSGEKFDRRGLGFHVPGAFDQVIHLSECHLMDSPAGEIRDFIYRKAIELNLPFYNLRNHEGLLRTLMLRRSAEGKMMVLLSFARYEPALIEEIMNAIHQNFPDLESLLYVINDKKNDTISDRDIHIFSGKAYLTETLGNNQFRITPKSFFQTNTRQAETLYEVVKQYAGLSGEEHVYDLYSGVGSIGIYLSAWCKKVTGIEQIPEAVEDAKLNASINMADHCSFFTGDVKLLLDEKFLQERGKPDVIVTDPPRAGMHEEVIKTLCASGVPRLVYVSCNPATMARDLSLMRDTYELIKVQPVDMFPHTPHIESVALLIKKSN
jgi:23S rRNA (uracil1939-C5)-methyltransferase